MSKFLQEISSAEHTVIGAVVMGFGWLQTSGVLNLLTFLPVTTANTVAHIIVVVGGVLTALGLYNGPVQPIAGGTIVPGTGALSSEKVKP